MSAIRREGEPHFEDVQVAGEALAVAVWGTGPRTVLGIHGITASSMSLAPVARHLGPEYTLLAPDLRGRGRSCRLPGPFGMVAHARDCAAALETLGSAPAVVLGESMGGFVAVTLAASRPDLVQAVVLADGGIPSHLPPDLTADIVLAATLGPALDRLRMVFPTRAASHDFWKGHPAFSEDWSPDVEAYVDYDLEETEGGYRSRVSEAAIRADGAQLLVEAGEIETALDSIRCPIALLRAPRNLLNQPTPLIPDELAARWQERLPLLSDALVEDTNHYTLVFSERGATALANQIATFTALATPRDRATKSPSN